MELEWCRSHSLTMQGNETGINLVCLDNRVHDTCKVLYLQRILHADSKAYLGKQIDKQHTVVSCCFQHTIVLFWRDGSDKLSDTLCGILESLGFTTFCR